MSDKKKAAEIKKINSYKKTIFQLSQAIERESIIESEFPMIRTDKLKVKLLIAMADKKSNLVELFEIEKDKEYALRIQRMQLVIGFKDLKNSQRALSQAITNSHTRLHLFFAETVEEEVTE